MLTERYSAETLRSILAGPVVIEEVEGAVRSSGWSPLPRHEDRQAWDSLPAAMRQTLIAAGEAAAGETWPALPATLYLECARTGIRKTYQDAQFTRYRILRHLALAECAEGQGRFTDAVADALWSMCEQSSWEWPAVVQYMQKAGRDLPDPDEPIVGLGAGESAAVVVWSDYLLRLPLAKVSPLLHKRVAKEVTERILIPCRQRNDFWWMGLKGGPVNNWCPWVSSNWLSCLLLLEQDVEQRVADVAKILASLDLFIKAYHDDGGCDEGPSYWNRAGATLFDCLDILHSATGGRMDVYDQPKIANIARYIHRVHLGGEWYANFSDAAASLRLPGGLIYRFGRAVDDPATVAMGAWRWRCTGPEAAVSEVSTEMDNLWRAGRAIFHAEGINDAAAQPPFERDAWLDGIRVMVARDREGTDAGLTLAAKASHNGENHNHNDVGQFMVYVDGRPALVDAGVGTYTNKTFGEGRYSVWTMQSAYHNLPTIDGVQQQKGASFAAKDVAYEANDQHASLSFDLAGAYPDEAGITSWRRKVELVRGQWVELAEEYELSRDVRELMLSLMTPSEVVLEAGRESGDEPVLARLRPREIGGGRLSAAMKVQLVEGTAPDVSVETIPLEDESLPRAWGEKLHRIVLRWPHPARRGKWRIRLIPE